MSTALGIVATPREAPPRTRRRRPGLFDAPLPGRGTGRLRIMGAVSGVALVVIPIVLVQIAPEALSQLQAIYSAIIVALCLLPTFLYLQISPRPPFPLMPLVGLFHAIAYGLPMFYTYTTVIVGLHSVSDETLLLVIGALVSTYFGYYLLPKALGKIATPLRLPAEQNKSRTMTALWILLGIHLFLLAIPSVVKAVGLDQFAVSSAYPAWGMLLIWTLRGYLTAGEKFVAWGVVMPIELLYRFTSGLLANVMIWALFFTIVYWIERRRLPWVTLVCGAVIFVPLNEAKVEFRAQTWFSGLHSGAGLVEKAQLFADLAWRAATDPVAKGDDSFHTDNQVYRATQTIFLDNIIRMTPSQVPYWNGATYTSIVYKLIPRLFWPDKPTETLGVEFSRRYGLRGTEDATTSINVPWLVEMYANFGTFGVLVGTTLVGFLFAMLELKFNSYRLSLLELMVGISILFDLFYQESNFSLMVGSKILLTVAFRLFFTMVLQDRKSTRKLSVRTEAHSTASP